jgi:arabinofuranosyltransferase
MAPALDLPVKYRTWIEAGLLFIACLLLVLWGIRLVGDFQVDDAYITFAYSKNVALGRGPIYGHDLRVEGYSNFLWMMLVAVGQVFKVEAISAARFFSHAFFALTLGSTWLVARKWGGSLAAALVVLCLAASSDFHRAIQSGLETVAFAGFISAGLAHYVLEPSDRRRFSLLWFAGASLVRIDGFVPLVAILGLEAARLLISGMKSSPKVLLRWLALGLVPPALYWIWRASYYGLPFPLTYYAKASLGIESQSRGADYLWTGLRESGLWIAALVACVALFEDKAKHYALLVFAFVASQVAYVVHVGGDWMPFNRMLLPVFPATLMIAAAGMGTVLRQLDARALWVRVLAAAVFAFGSWVTLQHLTQAFVDTEQEKGKLGHTRHITQHTLGLLEALPFIQAMVRAPGDKLVTDYGGVFAYGTDASVIEMWGLANKEIALRGNTDGINGIYGKTCVPCYAEFAPDYFHSVVPLLRDKNAFTVKNALIGQIFQGRAIGQVVDFKNKYVMGRVLEPESGRALWFLERKRDGVSFGERRAGRFVIDYPAPPRGRHVGRPPEPPRSERLTAPNATK